MNWFTRLFLRRRIYSDISEEIRQHLEEKVEEMVANGKPRKDAEFAARREFGNLTLTETDSRAAWQWPSIESLLADVRLSLRMLRKNPGFTAFAVITLALGIGANTAIFSVVKAVLLNQLPYREPERMVRIATGEEQPVTVDFTTTHDLRSRSKQFEAMSLFHEWRSALIGAGGPELITGLRVNFDYFDTLGVKMQLGRTFLPEEDHANRWNKVIILSHGLWVRRFGGDAHILGQPIRLNESTFNVVGVLPESFKPLSLSQADGANEIFAPLGYELGQPDACRGCQHLQLVGRLKAGVTTHQASAELNAVLTGIMVENPGVYNANMKAVITPLHEQLFGRVQTALWIIAGAASFVVLIACVNVANLLLARSTVRTKEMALRTALGAGKSRLIRQLLTESLILALAGGTGGALLAMFGTTLIVYLAPPEIPRIGEARIDIPVLLFCLVISLSAGVLFGLAPAFRASRLDLIDTLNATGRSTEGRGKHGLRNAMVMAEIALAFVLVAGAGLLGKSFVHLINVDPGFDPHNVITLHTYVYGHRYSGRPEVELNYYSQVFNRLRGTRGIESVAMVSTLPFESFDRVAVHIQDRPLANPCGAPVTDRYSVTPDYFRVMRIPLRRGHIFTDQDLAGSQPVAIISEKCVRQLFSAVDPIGKHIQLGDRHDDRPWMTIVGVAGDIRQYGLDRAPTMAVYLPQGQNVDFSYALVARTSVDPTLMKSEVRDAFLAVDKTQPVFDVTPMETYLSSLLAERRFTLALLGLFGTLALVLAMIGIYGVISYVVSLRTQEIGVRVALGAQQRDVLKIIIGRGSKLVLAGVAIGIAGAFSLTRLLSNELFDVTANDPGTYFGVSLLLSTIALAACYIPARRAMRIDPLVALRYE